MPNSLTEKWLPGSLFDDENEKKKTEQIIKDLEDVDDVFAANVWQAGMSRLPGSNLINSSK
jgi:hypothetical protein